MDQGGKGHAGCVGVEHVVRPLQMAVPLLSARPLPDQGLFHLHPTQMTDLPIYLPQAPANDSLSKGW